MGKVPLKEVKSEHEKEAIGILTVSLSNVSDFISDCNPQIS